MRKVVSPQEVAHFFAHQSQEEARSQSGSLYFYGKTIYSYGSHFCIAKFVDDRQLLFTERSYSNTTAKHIQVVRNATSHIDKIYCAYPTGSHEQNYHYWLNDAEDLLNKLPNARKPEIYLGQLENIKYKVDRYSALFKTDMPLTLRKALSVLNKAEVTEYLESKKKLIEAEAKRKAKQEAKDHAKALAEWRLFERQSLYKRDGFDYLRKDDENFQTTQGVKIPIAIGMRFYNSLMNNTVKAGDEFLNYKISEITNKHIRIGCHTITFNEIKTIVS